MVRIGWWVLQLGLVVLSWSQDEKGDSPHVHQFSPLSQDPVKDVQTEVDLDRARHLQASPVTTGYIVKVCSIDDPSCSTPFTGTVPQYQFFVRVECPPSGCIPDYTNRIKLVASIPRNNLNVTDPQNGCRFTQHGYLGALNDDGTPSGLSRFVMPNLTYTLSDGSSGGIINPTNCAGPMSCSLSGGNRTDYKDFGRPAGFRFVNNGQLGRLETGSNVVESRGFTTPQVIDVCYCNTDCQNKQNTQNWFKIGSIRLSSARLASSATSRSALSSQWCITSVNTPGVISLFRPFNDSTTLGLQENALVKLVADQSDAVDDTLCSQSGYSSQMTDSLSNEVVAAQDFLGVQQTNSPPDLQKLVFNSNNFANTIAVKVSGDVAICYCDVTVDNACRNVGNWKLVTRITLAGPMVNQQWFFSMNVVFRFPYQGYGLSSGNTLRIISSDSQCTDNNNNPNTAAYAYTGLKTGCPGACMPVTQVGQGNQGDLSTMVLSSNNYQCDRQNANCITNDITDITVVSDSQTLVTFEQPHGLSTGDQLNIGDNVICDPVADNLCTMDTLNTLKGIIPFADAGTNSPLAPEQYIQGRRITITSNNLQLLLSIGWPSPAPKFKIVRAGMDKSLGIAGRGGQWTHLSLGVTREEIMGDAEKANLRVCWSSGGSSPSYTQEVGLMTIKAPSIMNGAMLSMTTNLIGRKAPMILTFTTAGGVTGQAYDLAEDSTRLKLSFTQTNYVDITYSDLNGTQIPYLVPTDMFMEKATQSICGKLFLEVWSNDLVNGFPMPKGCYYVGYPNGNQREIYIVFEAKSGLRKSTTYQMVFNGLTVGSVQTDVRQLNSAGSFLTIYPMDDVTSRTYIAIEQGVTTFTSTMQIQTVMDPNGGAGGNTPVPGEGHWREPNGFKVVGGFDNLLQISSGASLQFDLQGDTNAPIQRLSYIRIFLWPLLQWQTSSSCNAMCVAAAEISFICGPIQMCDGLPVVPGYNLNIVKLQLPAQWQQNGLFGEAKIRIQIDALTIPAGGWFASRLAAQVTTANDDRPDYIISTGDYIWKDPNQGQPVAKVVSMLGGGNTHPFKGNSGNTLYLRVLLASTIMARTNYAPDASFTITLPKGYTCINPVNPPGDSSNMWMAPMTLYAYGSTVPQGRGTPDDGTISHGWTVNDNTCTFTPAHPFGVVYAGSSLMIKVTVVNPSTALQQSDPNNVLTIRYSNKGWHRVIQTTSEFGFFAAVDPLYQSNAVVMGRLSEQTCAPNTFTPSGRRIVYQEVSLFFTPEQQVNGGGSLRLLVPAGFQFDSPCNATDLPDQYYGVGDNPAEATERLPGIVSCVTGNNGVMATISLSNILYGGQRYGFKINIQNPTGFAAQQLNSWYLYTLDATGNLVDGTEQTIPFVVGDTVSWGLYAPTTMTATVTIVPSMQPYMMTQTRSVVQVLLKNPPMGYSGFIRFRAPVSYVWDFADSEFIFDTFQNTPAGKLKDYASTQVTATFPPGVPLPRQSPSEVLIFKPGLFDSAQVYGFAGWVQVPLLTPHTGTNSFYLEFGFNDTARPGGLVVPAPLVRALTNAQADYASSIVGKLNLLQFRLHIISDLPIGGGIEIQIPRGFLIDKNCFLQNIRDPSAPPFPAAFICRADYVLDESGVSGYYKLRLTATSIIQGNRQLAFGVLVQNPSTPDINYPAFGRPCGYQTCINFKTWTKLGVQATDPSTQQLDYGANVPAFDIELKMIEARLPDISPDQRAATMRDDRPLRENNLIFGFKLATSVSSNGPLLLRGPYGFIFDENCLYTVVTNQTTIFGLGNPFPTGYAVWPGNVAITACYGVGAIAKLSLSFAPGAQLLAGQLYLFRIGLLSNPIITPTYNTWDIHLAGQSSEDIQGMTLWAFTSTSVVPVNTAYDRATAGTKRTPNPLTISLQPYNTIMPGGKLKAHAPKGFVFVALSTRQCDASLQLLPYMILGVNYSGYVYPSDSIVCLVDANDPGSLTVTVTDTQPIQAGLVYQVVLSVYNMISPVGGAASPPTVWTFSSYQANGVPLDESYVTAFSVNTAMNQWSYLNPDPNNPGMDQVNGGAALPAFSILMRFPQKAAYGDTIVITAPPSFRLTTLSGQCSGFAWVAPAGVVVTDYNPLPNSRIVCKPTSITFFIFEVNPIVADSLLQFGMAISNPVSTPPYAVNFWGCTHFSPAGVILSSGSFQGWTVTPQLVNLQVGLVGTNKAASAMSSLQISFTPASAASDIAIQATQPSGFDFASAKARDPKQVVFLAQGNLVRLRMAIVPGTPVTIILDQVKLGMNGGATVWRLSTYVGGLFQNGVWNPGAMQDEYRDFRDGFRLPGSVVILTSRLQNYYQMNPAAYPVQALWSPQMGRPATAQFEFSVTQLGNVGDLLRISAYPYTPNLRDFSLQVVPRDASGLVTTGAPKRVAVTVLDATSGVLSIRLQEVLVPLTIYTMIVSVIAPQPAAVLANKGPVMWRIETLDSGVLPTNTNDGISREFLVTEEYQLSVMAPRAPPLSTVQVTISTTPGLKRCSGLLIYAPVGFNFTKNCLLIGNGFATACNPGVGSIYGNAAAVITLAPPGYTGQVSGIVILAKAPLLTPVDPTWFVAGLDIVTMSQLGWGSAPGFGLTRMADTSFAFPAVGGIPAPIVWQFRTVITVQAGGWLQVDLPKGFDPDCRSLQSIALPATGSCTVMPNGQTVIITLNTTLVPALYAFAFDVTPPQYTPVSNVFSLFLRDNTGNVADAGVLLPGPQVADRLRVESLPLTYDSTSGARTSTVAIGFQALETLPDIIVASDQQVNQILLTLPSGFIHQVNKLTDFQMLNPTLPLADGMWLNYMQKDRLIISLQNNRTTWLTIKQGSYLFKFTVQVPAILPIYNVWQVSLCSPNYPSGCLSVTDPAVLVNFAQKGFDLGDPPNSASSLLTASAHRSARPPSLWLLHALLLLTLLGSSFRFHCE